MYNAQQWPWSPVFSVSLGRASRPFPYWNLTDTSQFSQTICPVSSSDHRRPSLFEAAEGSSDRDGLDQGNCLCTMDKPSLAYNLLDVQPLLTHGSVTHTVALSLDVEQGSPALYALPRLYVSYGGSLAANAWRITKPCSVYNMATSNNWALSWFFTTFCSIDVLATFVRDVTWFTVVQRNLSTVLQAQSFPGWQFLWIFLHNCFVFPPSQLGVGLSPWQSFLGQFRYTIVFPCPVLHTSSEYTDTSRLVVSTGDTHLWHAPFVDLGNCLVCSCSPGFFYAQCPFSF